MTTVDAATRDAAKIEQAWRHAQSDILWCASLWWIAHPLGPRKWELYPAQREILTGWATPKGDGDPQNWLHLKARQLGFSTSVGFYAWWVAYFNPGTKVLLISKGERESAALLDKVKFGLDRMPAWLRARGPQTTSETQSRISFSNDSEILSLPSANNPARSFTGRLIVVDEWAFIENGEEAWASIEPTADIGGQIIGLSTANGMGNLFHTLWVRAAAGKSTFRSAFYGWDAVPGRDEKWYASKKMDLLDWQVAQEYPTDPDEAFIKSGSSVFNVVALKEIETDDGFPKDIIDVGTTASRFRPNPAGFVRVWEQPKPNNAYVMGVDVAEGLGHGDYSSIHVIDAATRDLVATWHGHLEADLFGQHVYSMGLIYNTALCVPEANNHGLTTITELRRLAYPKIYRSRSLNKASQPLQEQFGFKTTRGTKPTLIDRLGSWLREGNSMPCADTRSELMTYVRDQRGAMNGSPHDDRVISLALAVWGLDYAHQPEYRTEIDDYMTVDWWLRQCEDERIGVGITPLRSRPA